MRANLLDRGADPERKRRSKRSKRRRRKTKKTKRRKRRRKNKNNIKRGRLTSRVDHRVSRALNKSRRSSLIKM
jgi:hypothetical protein